VGRRRRRHLRAQGAVPVVAPLINFAPTNDQAALDDALAKLAAGEFDWLTITSATTVDVLFAHRAEIPPRRRSPPSARPPPRRSPPSATTSTSCRRTTTPPRAWRGQLIALEPEPKRILTLRSEIAKPLLTKSLIKAGTTCPASSRTAPSACRSPSASRDVQNGRINAILVTSGSVAEQVREQFPDIPDSTLLAAIGPRTAKDAKKAGLPITVVADKQTVDALIDAVSHFTLRTRPTSSRRDRRPSARLDGRLPRRPPAPAASVRGRSWPVRRICFRGTSCSPPSCARASRAVPIGSCPASCSTRSTRCAAPRSRRPRPASPASCCSACPPCATPSDPGPTTRRDPQRRDRRLAAEVGDALVVQTDLCLDEFTDHGHCGVLAADGSVDNDATLERYVAMALAQARAGSQLLG
jgi:uroporphyrinogen-III synthase